MHGSFLGKILVSLPLLLQKISLQSVEWEKKLKQEYNSIMESTKILMENEEFFCKKWKKEIVSFVKF